MFKKFVDRTLLCERCMMLIIVFNAILIFLQECGLGYFIINLLDVICTLIFLGEMIAKHVLEKPEPEKPDNDDGKTDNNVPSIPFRERVKKYWNSWLNETPSVRIPFREGVKKYWTSGLNVMDGLLVLISLPSVVTFFFPELFANLSFLLVLRIFRIFRFFRLVSFFKNFGTIARNFRLAMQQSYAIVLIFCIIIVTFALIGCCLFRDYAPAFFATPLDAIYATFRMFTVEGWYEIPDAVAAGMGSRMGVHIVRLYFCILLLIGGIIGMSLINSIFVDAMVSDNNDDVKDQLKTMESKIDELTRLLSEQRSPHVVVRDMRVTSPMIEPIKAPGAETAKSEPLVGAEKTSAESGASETLAETKPEDAKPEEAKPEDVKPA